MLKLTIITLFPMQGVQSIYCSHSQVLFTWELQAFLCSLIALNILFYINLVSEVGIVTKQVFTQVGIGVTQFTVKIILNYE